MEEGISPHLKKIEEKKTQEIEKKQEEKVKTLENIITFYLHDSDFKNQTVQ